MLVNVAISRNKMFTGTGVSPQKVLEQATRLVHEKYNFFEMTLQIEEFNDGMEDCKQCKMPQS